jgi:hypothetical protein
MPLAVPPPRDSRFGSPLVLSRVHWVRPELVAEVKFLTWNDDNLLRQVGNDAVADRGMGVADDDERVVDQKRRIDPAPLTSASTLNFSPGSKVVGGGAPVLTEKRYSVRLALMSRSLSPQARRRGGQDTEAGWCNLGSWPEEPAAAARVPLGCLSGPGRMRMLAGELALTMAAVFTGAAIYINIAEQPARRQLDDRSLLVEWKLAYKRGYMMQASLAVAGGVFGLAAFLSTFGWRWLLGAVVLLANWPYTIFLITPTNRHLMDTAPEAATAETRRMIGQWGLLHAGRSALGVIATLVFLWAQQ